MGIRQIKINSNADTQDAAKELSSITEVLKKLNLRTKSDNGTVYVEVDDNTQIAIYPESENKGKVETQVKENNQVKAEDSKVYNSLDELTEIISKKTQLDTSSVKKPVKQVIRAGKNYQEALQAKKLNASRNREFRSQPSRAHNRVPMNSSRIQNLSSGTVSSSEAKPLEALLQTITESTQKVQGYIFNKMNSADLYIAFYDEESCVYVLQKINVAGDGRAFETLDELKSALTSEPGFLNIDTYD